MRFFSTRNKKTTVSFQEAVFSGLAPDGGLYHPSEQGDIRDILEASPTEIKFTDLAAAITARLFTEEIPTPDAEIICTTAFPFEPHFNFIENDITILELYHGPSCAFKDFGASFLATVMEYFLGQNNRKAIILTATSGDTGSAVAQAFHRKENIDVVILYPSGRVSPLQEKQLTTLGDNITALEVQGAFDDCQRMVKEAFIDSTLKAELPLTSANSINLGRLLPQSFYYIYAYNRLQKHSKDFVFSVPSGNFGNLTAGVLAWEWGMDVAQFIAATNSNDVVPEYLQTGTYTPRPSIQTYSNAMDVGDPSNFERLLTIFNNSNKQMHKMLHEEVVNDEETLHTIRTVYRQTGQFLDPHTAVGYLAAQRYCKNRGNTPNPHIVSLSTAHPGKFLEIVEKAVDDKPALPPQLAAVLKKQKSSILIDNSLKALSEFLLDTFR